MKDFIELSNEVLENVIGGSRIEEAAAASAAEIKSIGAGIAARIIASTEALNARQEIRITIQENILRGTEVYILKDGKQLDVKFLPDNPQSGDLLEQNLSILQEQLKQTLQLDCVLHF